MTDGSSRTVATLTLLRTSQSGVLRRRPAASPSQKSERPESRKAMPANRVTEARTIRGCAGRCHEVGKAVSGGRWLILSIAFIGPISECNQLAKRSIHAEETREAIAAVHVAWQPGDRVYVFYGAVPAFEYYRSRYPIPAENAVLGVENRGKDPRQFREELRVLRGQKRVWILMAHRQRHEEAAIRAYLDGFGTGEIMMRGTDAVAMLYDLS